MAAAVAGCGGDGGRSSCIESDAGFGVDIETVTLSSMGFDLPEMFHDPAVPADASLVGVDDTVHLTFDEVDGVEIVLATDASLSDVAPIYSSATSGCAWVGEMDGTKTVAADGSRMDSGEIWMQWSGAQEDDSPSFSARYDGDDDGGGTLTIQEWTE